MLVSLKDILAPALDAKYALGCFNVFGYEDARAVVDGAEALGAPVILSANRDLLEFLPMDLVAHLFRTLAETASVPVCAHLDHCYEVETVRRALDLGFTSVMFDGSQLTLAENIAGTRQVVAYAARTGASVEAEIGSVPYASGRDHIKSALTDPAEARQLVAEAGPDALAVSIGNVPRLTAPGATVDFERLAEIEAVVDLPLVIHGSSGLREADVTRLAATRVCKFNIGTVLRRAFGDAVRGGLEADPALFDRLELMRIAMPAVQKETERMIRLLGWPASSRTRRAT